MQSLALSVASKSYSKAHDVGKVRAACAELPAAHPLMGFLFAGPPTNPRVAEAVHGSKSAQSPRNSVCSGQAPSSKSVEL